MCEVLPDRPCIWVKVYERAKAANRVDELATYIPPRNRALQGTSSYINYFLDRDSRPGHSEPLIQITAAPPPAAVQKPEQAGAAEKSSAGFHLVK
jgi:hypothetical protein